MHKLMLFGVGLLVWSSALMAEDFTTRIVDGEDISASPFYVGESGSFNYLEVRNGGVAACGALGFSEGANHNRAVVTGLGSLLTNSFFDVGYYGASNSLVITNGAQVGTSVMASVGFWTNAHFNSVSVSGSNSLWTCVGSIAVGARGHHNRLTVSDGARVQCAYAFLGLYDGSSSNSVLVTDLGTEWRCATFNFLEVGTASSGNEVTVTNRALLASNGGIIGSQTNASDNRVTVVGTNTIWTNSFSLTVGSAGSANQLTIAGGARVNNTFGYVGSGAGSISNGVLIDGPASRWINRESLSVGVFGSFNQLLISNGAVVQSSSGAVGANAGANSNRVMIAGLGSLWTNSASGQFKVGVGVGNQVSVSQGGHLKNRSVVFIGYGQNADGNSVVVADPGSEWTSDSPVYLGIGGSGNSLVVANHGTVAAPAVFLGWSGTSNNLLWVDGGNLIVTNGDATLESRRGNFAMAAGLTVAGSLLATNSTNGTIDFAGGTLRVRNSLVANASPLVVGDGTRVALLELAGGTNRFLDGLIISPAAVLAGSGVIEGLVTNHGTVLARGNAAGPLEIRGRLALLPDSQSSFEIGGAAPGDYGTVDVTNTVTFDGMLLLSLTSDFHPASSNTFTLMRFASATGAFANAPDGARLIVSDGSGSFRVKYSATSLLLDDFRPELTVFNPHLDPAACGFSLQFNSLTGRTYRVWYSTNLVEWNEIASPAFTSPAPGLWQWLDDGSQTGSAPPAQPGGGRFYRLSIE